MPAPGPYFPVYLYVNGRHYGGVTSATPTKLDLELVIEGHLLIFAFENDLGYQVVAEQDPTTGDIAMSFLCLGLCSEVNGKRGSQMNVPLTPQASEARFRAVQFSPEAPIP